MSSWLQQITTSINTWSHKNNINILHCLNKLAHCSCLIARYRIRSLFGDFLFFIPARVCSCSRTLIKIWPLFNEKFFKVKCASQFKFASSYHGATICSKPSMSSNGCLVIECSVTALANYTAMAVLISCASIQQCRAEQTSRVSLCRYRVASYVIECKSGN